MAFVRTLENKLYKNADGNKVTTDDWENVPIELWNSTTVIAYVNHLNKKRFGKEPIIVNKKLTILNVSQDLKKYGSANLKEFVTAAMYQYKPNPKYPTISYSTLRNFYMESIMPSILNKQPIKAESERRVKDFDVDAVKELF